jgi:mannose-1-phosphate guanylyltransferase
MDKAFVLGAGLGTRLRPLTDQLPKPLIPVFHRPLITFAFDHLIAAGVKEFIVNTHHLAQCYEEAFPNHSYRDVCITFRHEPVLLETAGGIANIADLVRDESFIVYNGDILTDLPLAALLKAHASGENIVTLALRSSGPSPHIAFDSATGRVTDIRNRLGTGNNGTHLFTGIYTVRPDFLAHLEPGKIESVIPIFLRLIQQGAGIGGVVIDEGQWWDLGDKSSCLAAHHALHELGASFPAYEKQTNPRTVISTSARIDPSATLRGLNVISAGATVGAGAVLEDCILWPNASVAATVHLKEVIVRTGCSALVSQTDSVV